MFKLKGDADKLLKGISFSWIRFGLTIGIGLVQTPILFKNLPGDQLNSWYIFYSFGAFLQMADLGLTQTISRLIAYVDNNESIEDDVIGELSKFKVKQIYITSIFSFLILIIIIGFGVILTYFNIQNQTQNGNELGIAFFIYLVSMVFTLLSNIPGAMLIGYRDIGPESVIRSIFQVIFFVSLLFGLPYYKSIVFVAISFLFQNVGMFLSLHLTFYLRHKKVFDEYCRVKDMVNFGISKSIYKQSFPLAINQLGGWLINQGNIFVASIIIGSQNISDYAINQQVFTYIASIALVVNQTMGPFIAKQYIQNKHDNLKEFFTSTTIFCLTIVSILVTIQMTCGYEIIDLWVGHEHYLGLTFSCIFAAITFLEVHHSVGGNFVWNTRSWPFNSWTLGAGVLNISLGYVIGKYYGLVGMAFATFVSKLITLNWYVIYYCLKRLKITISKYFFGVFMPIIIILITAFVIVMNLKNLLVAAQVNVFLQLVSVIVLCVLIIGGSTVLVFKKYIITIYALVISKMKSQV